MIEKQSRKYGVFWDGAHHSAGFTLTELMVVVAIISLIAFMGIPSYLNALPHMRLKSAAGEISGALQYSRMNAISHNSYYKVEFNYTSNKFTIYRKSASGAWGLGWTVVHTSVSSADWIDIDLLEPGPGVGIVTGGVNKVADSASQPSFVYKPDGTVYMTDNSQAVYMRNVRTPKNGYQIYRVKVTKNGIVNVQVYNGNDWVRG